MNEMDQLKKLIKEEVDKLVCDTHEHVCYLRDTSYPKLEESIIKIIFAEEEPVSVQTAIAELETELAQTISGDETANE